MNELEKRAKKHKKKQKGLPALSRLNTNAGNVEHNVNMFNHMNSPAEGPSNNPISGPFGGDVSAPAGGGMGESLDKPRFQVHKFNWTHEEVTLTCYDTIEDKEFEKFICYGALDEDTGRRNALAILKDDRYEIPYDIKNELISTYGLDDFGYKIEESKKPCYEGLDDKFDMSMRTLL